MSLIPQGICTAVVSTCPDHIMTTYTAQHLCHMLGVRDSSQPEVLVRGHCWYKSVAVNTGALCLLGLHVEGQQSHNSLKHCNKEIHFLRWYLPSDVCQHRLPSVPPDKPPSACPLLKEIAIMTETFWWLWKTHLLKYKIEKWKTELESKSWNMVCITELQWMRHAYWCSSVAHTDYLPTVLTEQIVTVRTELARSEETVAWKPCFITTSSCVMYRVSGCSLHCWWGWAQHLILNSAQTERLQRDFCSVAKLWRFGWGFL